MTTTIRVREPRDLLAYLPYQMGFHPRESAVFVSLRPPRGRIGLVARVDLDDLADVESGPMVADGVVTHLLRDGAEDALLVIYSDEAKLVGRWSTPVRAASEHAATAVGPRLGELQVWVVSAGRYYALHCENPACCPPEGEPIGDLGSSHVAAEMVLHGSHVADSVDELARVDPAPEARRHNAARVAARWRRRRAGFRTAGPGADAALTSWRRDSLRSWRRVCAAVADCDYPRVPDLGRLLVGLADPVLRDAVILTFVTEDDLPERTVELSATLAAPQIVRALVPIFDDDGIPPDLDRAHVWRDALRSVVEHGRARDGGAACTLLALLAWWSGDGAQARGWIEQARRRDEEGVLADLLEGVLHQGVPPGWVRGSRASEDALR